MPNISLSSYLLHAQYIPFFLPPSCPTYPVLLPSFMPNISLPSYLLHAQHIPSFSPPSCPPLPSLSPHACPTFPFLLISAPACTTFPSFHFLKFPMNPSPPLPSYLPLLLPLLLPLPCIPATYDWMYLFPVL